jgi:HSP20 family protein
MTNILTRQKPAHVAQTPVRSFFGNYFPRDLLDDMFEQFLTRTGNGPVGEPVNAAMDVAETDQAFEVKMDLPGVNAENVEIQINNNTLTVRGQRSEETNETDEGKQFHRVERYVGTFSRSVVLPGSINEDETAAEFKDGVLTIMIPKAEEAKPRKIKIKH